MPRGQPTRIWTRHHLPADVADALRQARLDRGLSIHRAADLVGVDVGYLSRLENGKRAPRTATVWKLADGLDLDEDLVDRLLGEAVDAG